MKRLTLADLLVGLPAGLLVFMSTALFTTLLGRLLGPQAFTGRDWLVLPVLAANAFIVGLLSGLARKGNGPASALIAGLVAAAILLILRLNAGAQEQFNPVLLGLPGMVTAALFPFLGAWLVWRHRKAGAG